jgi:UDP-N-acetylmuramoyl-L-alanyl-D-glutamate--2,6-diaminopimelate ligase
MEWIMDLLNLIKNVPGIEVKGNSSIKITGLCANSKSVAPGNLFIAKRGKTFDGLRFLPDAVNCGAVAVLSDLYDPFYPQITQIIAKDVTKIEAIISERFYQQPWNELKMVGITGTNGKTTTSFLIKHILDQKKCHTGLIGTIEYILRTHRYSATHTTPDLITVHKLLREMVRDGCQAAVMETTSHALVQGRCERVEFDCAIFTNLTQDHLDYHKTMEEYAAAKKRLFSHLKSGGTAIVNCDDPWTDFMLADFNVDNHIIRYSIDQSKSADLTISNICYTPAGTDFTLHFQGKSVVVHWNLVGKFNLYNAMAATAASLTLGLSLQDIAQALASFDGVPGRMQRVINQRGLNIIVDFAHTPDALENVLLTLREIKPKRIITVFGCGGDRDPIKRPLMGTIAQKYSDHTFVTSDNPRSESPQAICEAICAGLSPKGHPFAVVVDRKEAIAKAIAIATKDDIVLIAGKGHETKQIFARETVEFDDRLVACEVCDALPV